MTRVTSPAPSFVKTTQSSTPAAAVNQPQAQPAAPAPRTDVFQAPPPPPVTLEPPSAAPQTAKPSTLLAERSGDRNVNCIDRAQSWLATHPTEAAGANVVFLHDASNADGNGAGHVVIKLADGRFVDPSQPERVFTREELEARGFRMADSNGMPVAPGAPYYQMRASHFTSAMNAPTTSFNGSNPRAGMLDMLGVPRGIQSMRLADEPVPSRPPEPAINGVMDVLTPAQTRLSAAQTAYTSASAARERLDTELAQQLAELEASGLQMTDEQRTQYIQAYRARHPEYAAEATAAAQLATAMQEMETALTQAAALPGWDPNFFQVRDITASMHASLQVLGSGPQAAHATAILSRIMAAPDSPIARAMAAAGLAESLPELMTTAATNALAARSLVVGMEAALAELQQQMDVLTPGVVQGWSQYGGSVNGAFSDLAEALAGTSGPSYFDDLRGVMRGDAGALQRVLSAEDSRLGRGLQAIAGVAALLAASQPGASADFGAQVQRLLVGTAGATEIVTAAVQAIANGSKLASAAGVVSRIGVPLLSLAADTVALLNSTGTLLNDPSRGHLLTATADLASVVGSVLLASGVAAPIGAFLVVVGPLLSAAGGILHEHDLQTARDNEQRAILGQIFPDRLDMVEMYATTNSASESFAELQAMGLSNSQAADLLARYPELFANSQHGLRTLTNLTADMTLFTPPGQTTGDVLMGLFDAVARSGPGGAEQVYAFMRVLDRTDQAPSAEWADWLQHMRSSFTGNPDTLAAIDAASAYLSELDM